MMTQKNELPANDTKKLTEKNVANDHGKEKAAYKGNAKSADKILPKKSDLEPGAHKQIGFVTSSGILFPVGFKFKGGHISSKGSVVLNLCPKCGHHQYPSQAVKGFCEKVHEKKGCGFDMMAELEEFQL
jgi:hypothetical protein